MSPVKPIWITIISKPTARWELVPCSSGTLIFLKSLEPSLFSHFVPPAPGISSLGKEDSWCAGSILSTVRLSLVNSVTPVFAQQRLLTGFLGTPLAIAMALMTTAWPLLPANLEHN